MLASAGIAGFALQVISGVYAHGSWRPLVWGLPAAAIIGAAALSNWNVTAHRAWRPFVLLGAASYALYLVHPMGVHAIHLLCNKLGLAAHASETVYFFVALAPLPLLAIAIYLYFEKPVTKTLQTRLAAYIPRLVPAVADMQHSLKHLESTRSRGATA
jgi:exopolysaccharide production protein ExoZ